MPLWITKVGGHCGRGINEVLALIQLHFTDPPCAYAPASQENYSRVNTTIHVWAGTQGVTPSLSMELTSWTNAK